MKRRNLVKIDDAKFYEREWAPERWVGHVFDYVRLDALLWDVRPGHRLLDVGAGVWGPAQYLAQRRPDLGPVELVAFDQSYTARDIVLAQVPSIRWVLGDAERRLPFADHEFDVVVSGETIEHMLDPGAFARELMRVGKHGAVSSVNHDCEQSKRLRYAEHLWELGPEDVALFPGGTHEYVGNYNIYRW